MSCGKPKFNVMSRFRGKPEYYKCYVCDTWGDCYEFLRFQRDVMGDPRAVGTFAVEHQALMVQMSQDYLLSIKVKRRKERDTAGPDDPTAAATAATSAGLSARVAPVGSRAGIGATH